MTSNFFPPTALFGGVDTNSAIASSFFASTPSEVEEEEESPIDATRWRNPFGRMIKVDNKTQSVCLYQDGGDNDDDDDDIDDDNDDDSFSNSSNS